MKSNGLVTAFLFLAAIAIPQSAKAPPPDLSPPPPGKPPSVKTPPPVSVDRAIQWKRQTIAGGMPTISNLCADSELLETTKSVRGQVSIVDIRRCFATIMEWKVSGVKSQ